MKRYGAGRPKDQGAGAVLVVIAMALLLMLGGAVMVLMTGSIRSHRTQTVADLAAEAAAVVAVSGGYDPCARAAFSARVAGYEVVRCEVAADVVTVEVLDPVRSQWWPPLRAVARAGPVEDGA